MPTQRKTRGSADDDAVKKEQRMQHILQKLIEEQQTSKKVTKRTLAKELGVSEKTIQRDLESFATFHPGYSVEYDPQERTRYLLNDTTGKRASFSSSKVYIDEYTVFNLLMARHVLSQFQDSPVFERLSESVDTIANQLPPQPLLVKEYTIKEAFSPLSTPVRRVEPSVFTTIKDGITDKIVIKIKYKQAKGKQSRREIEPLRIISHDGNFYTIAWCRLRQDIRLFALSRITEVIRTNDFFEDREVPEIASYLEKQFGVFMDGMRNEYAVKLQFSKDQAPFIREQIWHKNQKIKELKAGGLILSFKTNHLFEVARWVLSWGADVTVLAPVELKEDIKKQLQRALAQY